MKLSRFGAKLSVLFTFTVLVSNSFAAAGEHSNLSQEASDFQARLQRIYADKNRPTPNDSTHQFSLKVPRKTNIPLSAHTVRVEVENAVDDNLFESSNSLEVTLTQLLSLEPKSEQMIELLNQQATENSSTESNGTNDLVKQELNEKKFYLDSNEVISAVCKNNKFIAKDRKIITACQNDNDIHFNVQWLRDAGAVKRTELITHELILGWVRTRSGSETNEVLEQKTRELNQWLKDILQNK